MAQSSADALTVFMGAVAAPLRSVGLGRRSGGNCKSISNESAPTVPNASRSRSPRFYSPGSLRKSERSGQNYAVTTHVVMNNPRWEHVSRGGSLGADQKVLSCDERFGDQELYAAAAGSKLATTGVTEFELMIVKSKNNSGGGMLLGVIEDVGFRSAGETNWGRVWGLTPWNGRAFSFPHGDSRGASRAGERPGDAVMQGDCRRGADGTIVRVRVDSSRRQLWFKVESSQPTRASAVEQDWVLAQDGGQPLVLPLDVAFRPFARCAHLGECIMMGAAMKQTVATPPLVQREAEAPVDDSSNDIAVAVPLAKRSQAAAARAIQQIEQLRPEAKREAELLEQVEKLKKELETTRLMLETERMLRRKAEAAHQASMLRAEAPIEGQQGQGRRSEVGGTSALNRSSAHEIQAALLRQVMLSDVDSAKASVGRSRRTSRELPQQQQGIGAMASEQILPSAEAIQRVSEAIKDERPIWDGIHRPRRRSRDSLSSIDLQAF